MGTVGFCPNCGAEVDLSGEMRPFAYHNCGDGKIGCIPIPKREKKNHVSYSEKRMNKKPVKGNMSLYAEFKSPSDDEDEDNIQPEEVEM